MTDAALVAKKLAQIESCLSDLRRLARVEAIASDVREQRFVEHTLQSDASVCASRVNRARRSGSFANESGSTLSATSRFSFVSRARNTWPMPPSPMATSTS